MSFIDIPTNSKRVVSLTPLIDVVFILIMFFMLTTQFERTQVLDVLVSSKGASAAQVVTQDDTVRVVVLNDGTWQLNNQQFSINDTEALRELTTYKNVRVSASDDAILQDVINLVDELAKVGVSEVVWLPDANSAVR